ncbi:MAG: hypothetical protein CMJ18_08440 [Phycisphaeraceae bacterium]|nr:hypothetical protein [Phycisphaeraceae bacterium]
MRFPPLARYSLVGLLLVLHLGLAVSSVRLKSTTFDERPHLTAGVSFWWTHDYRLNPEGGMLSQRWAALPALYYGFIDTAKDGWRDADIGWCSYEYFYGRGKRVETLLWSSRSMNALWGTAICVLVLVWAWRLFGTGGGMIALAAAVFSPTLLAHGPLVTADVCTALFFVLAVGATWRAMHLMTPLTIAGVVLAVSGLLLSKMSGVLILPMAALLTVVRIAFGRPLRLGWTRRPSRRIKGRARPAVALLAAAVLCAAGTFGVVWGAYGFRYAARHPDAPSPAAAEFDWTAVDDGGFIAATVEKARDHRLLPEAYLYGFNYARRSTQRRIAYLDGEYSLEGWWRFFPLAFLYKTPSPMLLLFGMAAAALPFRRRDATGEALEDEPDAPLWYRTAPLWVLLLVYGGFSLTSSLNIGHRHLLPIYPVLFVMSGAAVRWFDTAFVRAAPARRWSTAAIAMMIASLAAVSLKTWPNYLASFNTLAGGPSRGYTHLVDSSLDWGQDLPALKSWLDGAGLQEPDAARVYLSFFGTAVPEYHGLQFLSLPSFMPRFRVAEPRPLRAGVYCISATMLHCLYVGPRGPWCAPYEHAYQTLRPEVRRLMATRDDPSARRALLADRGPDEWRDLVREFEHLRFARLCAYLRVHRRPDAQIGFSIHVYHLDDQQIAEALDAAPAEMHEKVMVRGAGD